MVSEDQLWSFENMFPNSENIFPNLVCVYLFSNLMICAGRSSGANYICICVVLQTVRSSGALVIGLQTVFFQRGDNNDRQGLWLCLIIIHYVDAQYQHCSGGAVLFVEIVWKSELSSVGASCFFQFFVFLFLPETGITAQAAPPQLIIFVFVSYYKRCAPPDLWLFFNY